MSLPMLLNLGMSGVSFAGADIGGFSGSPSDEMFTRWIQAGMFYPFCRNHTSLHTAAQEPWAFSEEAAEISKSAIEQRYRLLPYTYSLFEESSRKGLPIMRAMIFEFPKDERLAQVEDQFMWGPWLLVAPVVEKAMTSRKIILPEGKWISLEDEQVYEGPDEIQVPAPLGELPILLRAGAILPQAPLMQHTREKPWDPVSVDVYPDSLESSFTMYEDDGTSLAFERGEFRRTKMSVVAKPWSIEFRIHEREGSYEPGARNLILRFHGIPEEVESVTGRDGADFKWTYDNKRQLLFVDLKDTGRPVRLTAKLK